MDIANIGAHAGAGGAVIITGTGSCGYVKLNNQDVILGAHGFPIGDQAGGAWTGLKAIEHTLLVLDGFIPESILASLVCKFFEVEDALSISEKIMC